jgi:Holliday junction resolvase RusA-like endonuclease
MNDPIWFLVEGNPLPKQSYRSTKSGGYTPARVKAWQNEVAWKAKEAMQNANREIITGSVSVIYIFVRENRRKVDYNNLCKPVDDAMNGIVFEDDSQIINAYVMKKFVGNPGVMVFVFDADQGLPITIDPAFMNFMLGKR